MGVALALLGTKGATASLLGTRPWLLFVAAWGAATAAPAMNPNTPAAVKTPFKKNVLML